jgi:hypothetical protein
MLVEIWRLAVEAYASRTGGRMTLARSHVQAITGLAPRYGEPALSQLCAELGYEWTWLGASGELVIRNLAEKQYFHSTTGGATPPTPPPLSTEYRVPSTEGEEAAAPPPVVPRGTKDEEADDPTEPAIVLAPEPHRCRACGAEHPKGQHPMPRTLSEVQATSLLRWAERSGFSEAQARHACGRVRGWADAGGKRKACWVATVRNAMTEGWGLQGFKPPSGQPPPERRTSSTFRETPREVAMKLAVLRLLKRDGKHADPADGPLAGYSLEEIEADIVAFMGPERARELECEVPDGDG